MRTSSIHPNAYVSARPESMGSLLPARAGDEVIVDFYETDGPHSVERALEKLYQHIYCTLARTKMYGSPDTASAFVSGREDKMESLILFRFRSWAVIVLSRSIPVNATQTVRFWVIPFEKCAFAQRIHLYALDTLSAANAPGFVVQQIAPPKKISWYCREQKKSSRRIARARMTPTGASPLRQ